MIPLAAFILVNVYFSLLPLLSSVPAAVVGAVRLVLFAGVAGGIGAGVRAVMTKERFDIAAVMWLVALVVSIALTLMAGLGMTIPWLFG